MLIMTADAIPGRKYEMLGIAKGSTIQTVHAGKDIMNSFKTLVGGELTSYNEMMNKARALAPKRLEEDAQSMGADAVVAMRYSSSSVMQGASEIMAYGTAIRFTD